MTDARFPERWLNDRRVLRLSDAAYRLFVTSLAWSVSNRTDGVLYDDDLPLVPGVDTGRADELRKAGLWDRYADHWLIVDYRLTQTTRDELDRLERIRRAERQKKARQRERKAHEGDSPPAPSPGTVPGDDTGQDRQGQDRQGALEPNGWPEVRPPGSGFPPVPVPASDQSEALADCWEYLAPGYDR